MKQVDGQEFLVDKKIFLEDTEYGGKITRLMYYGCSWKNEQFGVSCFSIPGGKRWFTVSLLKSGRGWTGTFPHLKNAIDYYQDKKEQKQ